MNTQHGGRLFAIAAARGWDWRDVLDFSANINPLGASPLVRPAVEAALGQIAHYPDSRPAGLLQALAAAWQAAPEELLLGNGATELIHFLPRVWHGTVTIAVPAFSEFHRVFPSAAQVPIEDPSTWPHGGMLILTRPVNPTGAMPELRDWLTSTRNPVLVDESFLEFTGAPSVRTLAPARPNLYVLRSLTKFYALPGLRLGALLGAPAEWHSARDPWSVNTLAAAAGEAAVHDRAHGQRSLALVRAERAWLTAATGALPGHQAAESHANYLCVTLPQPARELQAFLEDRRILIRDCTGWPGVTGDRTIRIAVRTHEENQHLMKAWGEFAACSVA